MSITVAALELIPETSAAEQLVADAYAIDASIEDAARVRDCVPLWFHTFALAPGVYTPGDRTPVVGPPRVRAGG